MARERISFTLRGKHYESVTDCYRQTGLDSKVIAKERTNVKRIKITNNQTVITPSTKPIRDQTGVVEQTNPKVLNRRKIEDLQEERASRCEDHEYWL
jgi:hypothetical protein